jgi:ubiquinol-cytochrome c reductase cytochrome b subunit
MKALLDWLEDRTGYRGLLRAALDEHVPGGARWRYVWGSTLTFVLFIQFVTGIVLWMAYSPSSQTAWESVSYIQHEMWGGWVLRGLHHYAAQAMNVLLVLHLMQVIIDGAYKAPRELNFWMGLLMLQLVLALSLTGYLLPWDQKGYWATKVATNIVAITPFVGPELQRLLIGGADYGHHTLTRFFSLHAGVLPAALVALLVGHIYLFRRHGLTAKRPFRRPDAKFWPDQVFQDAVACLAVLAAILGLTLVTGGADLGAPADPSEAYSAARPEWYFLFLFEFLKYFPGTSEIWGAIIIPGMVMGVVALMPLLGRTRFGHQFNVTFLCALLAGAGLLTWRAYDQDQGDAKYLAAVADAQAQARRVLELARSPAGIPAAGAVSLLRQDPLTQGPKLFAQHCASCHRYGGQDGLGGTPADPSSAPDLKGFGTRQWLAGFLDPARITSEAVFGGTRHREGKMVNFVNKKVTAYNPERKTQLEQALAALSAEAQLPVQRELDAREAAVIREGQRLLREELGCIDCHEYRLPDADATAPRLTGYGSRAWLTAFIGDPALPHFYGRRNDRMPRYATEQILTPEAIGLLVDWLRGDWYSSPQ